MNSQVIRFSSNCRDGLSWFKGDLGEIKTKLAVKPEATSDIYLITVREKVVWATGEDFEIWNQLSLF